MRFYDLEHQFEQISAQIAKTSNPAELAVLQARRHIIVAEARDIVNQLGILEPVWCWNNP
jgi:hypothetical protein